MMVLQSSVYQYDTRLTVKELEVWKPTPINYN